MGDTRFNWEARARRGDPPRPAAPCACFEDAAVAVYMCARSCLCFLGGCCRPAPSARFRPARRASAPPGVWLELVAARDAAGADVTAAEIRRWHDHEAAPAGAAPAELTLVIGAGPRRAAVAVTLGANRMRVSHLQDELGGEQTCCPRCYRSTVSHQPTHEDFFRYLVGVRGGCASLKAYLAPPAPPETEEGALAVEAAPPPPYGTFREEGLGENAP